MSTRQSNQENSSIFDSNRSRRQQPTPSNIPSNQQQEPLNSSPSHSDQASKACCFCWCCCCSCSWYVDKKFFLFLFVFCELSQKIFLRCVALSNIFRLDFNVHSFEGSLERLYLIIFIYFDDWMQYNDNDNCTKKIVRRFTLAKHHFRFGKMWIISFVYFHYYCWFQLILVKWNMYSSWTTTTTTRKNTHEYDDQERGLLSFCSIIS